MKFIFLIMIVPLLLCIRLHNTSQFNIETYTLREIPNDEEIPLGWRMLSIGEASRWKDQITPHLGQWGIVCLDGGKIDGSGYGNKISKTQESCGNKFIIIP
jgi:hypothetical protein